MRVWRRRRWCLYRQTARCRWNCHDCRRRGRHWARSLHCTSGRCAAHAAGFAQSANALNSAGGGGGVAVVCGNGGAGHVQARQRRPPPGHNACAVLDRKGRGGRDGARRERTRTGSDLACFGKRGGRQPVQAAARQYVSTRIPGPATVAGSLAFFSPPTPSIDSPGSLFCLPCDRTFRFALWRIRARGRLCRSCTHAAAC